MIGRTLTHYRIDGKLGEGGMGVVYRAFDQHLDRPVAIKLLRGDAVADAGRKARFVQEAKAASALNHPNIVTIHDIITTEVDGAAVDFIVMEFIAGQTLDQKIGRKGLAPGEALKYAVQIADALARAHGAGIVHRDLKPANVMVTGDGHVKVLDFGLAKLTERQSPEDALTATMKPSPVTEEGAIVGTVAYMSPEQAEGKRVDPRTDIFSFGSVLYEMITGRRAFQGETRMSTLAAVLNREPTAVSEVSGAVPRDLERIISRCLRKDPARRIQTMMDLKVALEELKEESDSGRLDVAPPRAMPRRRLLPAITAATILIAATAALTWWLLRSKPPARGMVLTRLTSDSGLTTEPALSPDGKLVAFASDRAGEGNLDIWVQQVDGGKAVRVTRHPADDREPAFSPDGQTIAFRSARDGGGIYVTSILAREGEERLIAPQGRRPRFSPDGSQIAYTVGHGGGALAAAGTGKIFIEAAAGGTPRQFQPGFASAAHPVWSPDGKYIFFFGNHDPNASFDEALDWWVAPAAGGPAVRTGAFQTLRSQGFGRNFGVAGDWLPDGDRIIFSGSIGDSTNLWQMPIERGTWKMARRAERLTSSTGIDAHPSAAIGPRFSGRGRGARIAFASLAENLDIWSLPLASERAQVTGEIQRLTGDTADDNGPSLSADGTRLVFASRRSGNPGLWLKDLKTGKEAALASHANIAVISPGGMRVAFLRDEEKKRAIYLASTDAASGVAEKLCEDCGEPMAWFHDEKRILGVWHDTTIFSLDISSRRKVDIQTVTKSPVALAPHLSPDDRWIAITTPGGGGYNNMLVIPNAPAGAPSGQRDLIKLSDSRSFDHNPTWSPDGAILYFFSDRDGFRCLWAMRLDRATMRPAGAPFPVYHLHNARRSAMDMRAALLELCIAPDKAVFVLNERTGNIWMAEMKE